MKINTKKMDVIWSYLGYALNLAINVILLPWILQAVPRSELGIWYTFASISAIVNTVDFGFSPTIIRNLTYAWSGAKVLKTTGVQYIEKDSSPNYELFNKVLIACKYLYLGISIFALFILLTIGSVYVSSISEGLVKKAVLAWMIYAFACFLNLYYSYWPLALKSIGKMAEAQKSTVASKIIQFIASLVGLKLGGDIIALAVAYLLSGLALRICSKLYFFRLDEIKNYLSLDMHYERKEIFQIFRTLWVNAKKAGISTISTTVMSQAGTIVCSGVLGVNSTAEYGLVLQLITVLVGVGQIIYQIHIPVLTNAKIINDLERQQRKFSLSVVGFFLITIMGMFFCVLFLGDIISLIKSNTVFNNTLFLGVALYYIPENNYSIHASYISIGNELPFVKSLVFTSLLRILLLFLGTYILRLGLWGIVFAGIISDYVYIIWKWPSVALKQLQLTPLQLIKVGFSELYRLFFGGRLQKAKGF